MKKNYPYLKDSSFLKRIDEMKVKEQYVKITVLNFQEQPIKEIQGRSTGGSLNLDGKSAIRRTGNISLITKDYESDLGGVRSLLSINKKVEIEIGFKNTTDQWNDYDIIWFPQGIYVIINPSITHNSSGINISLQLKDKMCLLNGECGGTIPASTDFHKYDTVDESGAIITTYPTIFQIIQELVHHFGGEQLSKIIISDVDLRIKKVMKWMGKSNLYFYQQTNDLGQVSWLLSTKEPIEGEIVKRYKSGQDVGYIYTDFTYPGELVSNAGESVCSMLDKIKNVLGNYEYFYDIDGNFVFQEIKNYLNTTQATVELGNLSKDDYLIDMSKGKSVYTFDSKLGISFSNSPQYGMIKNDFIVWGSKENSSGTKVPIRYHLAIDSKPKVGNTYKCFFFEDEDGLIKAKCPLIFNSINDFPKIGTSEVFYMDGGNSKIYKWDAKEKAYVELTVELTEVKTRDWRDELYLSGTSALPYAVDSNYYFTELNNEWPKLYDTQNGEFLDEARLDPSDIDYYLDFIDSTAAISEFSISNIGRRTKVITDDSINCIFEPEIPNYVIIENNTDETEKLVAECIQKGQDFIQVDKSIFNMLSSGGSLNSAYNLVREMLYQYTSYNESVALSSLPVYYLEPNTRITIKDSDSGVFGDYIINSISLPLGITGTMNISCIRAIEKI